MNGHRHLRRILVVVAALVVLAASAARTQARGPLPSLPAAPDGIAGNGHTEILIQNREPEGALQALLDCQSQSPGPPISVTPPPIPALGVGSVDLAAVPQLLDGAYAVTATGDRQLAVVDWTSWPVTGGQVAGNAAASGKDVVVPLVRKGTDECTLVVVQNTDQVSPTTFTISFYAAGSDVALLSATLEVAPGASITTSLCDDFALEPLPFGFSGWAWIHADRPVAAASITDLMTSQAAVFSAEGVPVEAAGDRWTAPMVAADALAFGGYMPAGVPTRTEIVLVNVGDDEANVDITYHGVAEPCRGLVTRHGGVSYRIPPRDTMVFEQEPAAGDADGNSGLPQGCLASAAIDAPGARLVGLVVARYGQRPSSPALKAAAYDLVATPPDLPRIYLPIASKPVTEEPQPTPDPAGAGRQLRLRALIPRVKGRPGGAGADHTWLFATNVGPDPTSLELVPCPDGQPGPIDCGGDCLATLAPGAGTYWSIANLEPFPDDAVCRAQVLADGPIAVTVLQVGPDLRMYDAIPPADGAPFGAQHVPLALR
jgi:hypothetical protein